MTLVDNPKAQPTVDEAQLLFHEAKVRRRRRWLVAGIVAAVLAVVLGLTLGFTVGKGNGAPSRTAASPGVVAGIGHGAAGLAFRPVLCAAPSLTLSAGQTESTGPLPTCAPANQWTAANLGVNPDSHTLPGYSSNLNGIQPDPQFASYPSTVKADRDNSTVVLPATAAAGGDRYVLGPAALTGAQIKSGRAIAMNGQWIVEVVFTGEGSARLDTLAQRQFHAAIGVVLNGKVISAPITQPTQSSFTPFNGQVQISGGFSEAQAKAIASSL